jgi:hypothetical protein
MLTVINTKNKIYTSNMKSSDLQTSESGNPVLPTREKLFLEEFA